MHLSSLQLAVLVATYFGISEIIDMHFFCCRKEVAFYVYLPRLLKCDAYFLLYEPNKLKQPLGSWSPVAVVAVVKIKSSFSQLCFLAPLS